MADQTQPWATVWLPATLDAVRQIAGNGANDPVTGNPMPNLSAIDTIALIGIVSPAVVSAINRFNSQYNDVSDAKKAVVVSSNVQPNGQLNGAAAILAGSTGDAFDVITAGATQAIWSDAGSYLQFSPDPAYSGQQSATPWRRYSVWDAMAGMMGDTPNSFEPYAVDADDNKGTGTVLGFLRQLISDYQHMIDASASAIATNAANTTNPAPPDDLGTFIRSLGAVCSDLDVLGENPPAAVDISGALRYALSKSSEFAGKAVAEIANEVGKTAGNVGANLLGGFLENAGLMSILVVGLVGYLYLR